MAKSLQDQLMGSGLIDKKKAKTIQKEKRIQRKQLPKGHSLNDKEKEHLEKLKQEKIEKDKELNKKRVEALEKKALKAQVKQLITTNEIKRITGEIAFQFTDDKKIKRIYLQQEQYDHLAIGLLAIANINEEYILVPKGVAKKIVERDAQAICYLYEKEMTKQQELEEDDPYKGFEIPDDLMW
tara:strand:- start:1530 stop:2078 length:549 start_codon:yes stop_codon:yes gene_type:complete